MKSRKIFILSTILFFFFLGTAHSQTRNFHIEGPGEQLGVIQTTTNAGTSMSGIELIRGNAFSGTDWRIVNQGGTFKLFDGTDNFATPGDENLQLHSSGTMTLLQGSEASIGNGSGVLVLGNSTGANLALDNNEILARNGNGTADLFLQPGGNVGNTYINIADGNVGIGDVIAPVKLSVFNGTDVNSSSGGYILVGSQSGINIGMDNNEIMARNGSNPSNLFLQANAAGNVSIGASEAETTAKLTVEDDGFQVKLTNANDNANDWHIGASAASWLAGAGKLVFNDNAGSANPILMLDGPKEAVSIGTSYIPAGFKFAVAGKTICEEVQVELEGDWPDFVFTPEYQLRSIAELDNEIKRLGHLPDLPSAQQVKEEGIALGAMQKILVQKIEELTLYIIGLKKENEAILAELQLITNP